MGEKYSQRSAIKLKVFAANDRPQRLDYLQLAAPVAMASVYKSVSKKKANQTAENVDGDDVFMQDVPDDSSDSEEEEENDGKESGGQSYRDAAISQGLMPKTRVLCLTSRGVTHR